ncbi:MAG: hypothetical protein ACRCWF_01350 [Beijerinckiaceae bacterium]
MTLGIHGYAIVCQNDCIADADNKLPQSLMNDADWQYFQAELDKAAVVVLGRASHEATPNVKKRRRLILSRQVRGLSEKADGWWWNPAEVEWASVVDRLKLHNQRIGVPGGQVAFDLFLKIGFAAFHLSRAERVRLAGGRTVFSGIGPGRSAGQILVSAGLKAGDKQVIDAVDDVTLTVFRRAAGVVV